MTTDKQLPEAPVSITFKLLYKGSEILVTKREINAKILPFLEDTKLAIDWALSPEGDFQIAPPRSFGFPKKEVEYVEGRTCPICGGRVVKNSNPKGPEFKCENQKWNFTTKMIEGCKWNEWGKNGTRAQVYEKFDSSSY